MQYDWSIFRALLTKQENMFKIWYNLYHLNIRKLPIHFLQDNFKIIYKTIILIDILSYGVVHVVIYCLLFVTTYQMTQFKASFLHFVMGCKVMWTTMSNTKIIGHTKGMPLNVQRQRKHYPNWFVAP